MCGYGTNYYLLRAPSLLEVCVLLRKSGHFLQTFLGLSCVCILLVFNRSPYTWRNLTTEREAGASDGEEKEIISILSLAICGGAWLKQTLMDTLHFCVVSRALCPSHSVAGPSQEQGDRELMEYKCTDRLKYLNFMSITTWQWAGKYIVCTAHKWHTGWLENGQSENLRWTAPYLCVIMVYRERDSLILKPQTREHCSATLCWQHCVKLLWASCLSKGASGQGERSMREKRLQGNFVINRY